MLIFSTWLDLVRVGLRGAEDADIEYMARFGKGRVERSRGC